MRVFRQVFLVALIVVGSSRMVVIGAPAIVCTVSNDSSFSNSYEIFDNVCNVAKATISLPAHGTSSLSLCSNGALSDGYASFKSKKTDSGSWNNFDQIRSGETRSLN